MRIKVKAGILLHIDKNLLIHLKIDFKLTLLYTDITTFTNSMITLIVLNVVSALSHIKHISVVGIRKAVTEPVASAEADLCSSNLSGRTSAELSQSTVPAHNCGDGAAPSKLVATISLTELP